ncbi:DNA replication protein [Amphibacillus marinus]|uniref:DNA replication protein n=1 Tax=Amphibacillus marinus TaxID=872970 RepID=A0A1H8GLC9_9BACI|nr:DnaD domain protein [Amphibacillus marinus]SEN44108.1 DNA replication protein [Amphibacillus marinus]
MKKTKTYQSIIQDQLLIPSKLISGYHKFGITEQELALILQIHRFHLKQIYFPTPTELASFVSFDEQICSQLLRTLLQKGYLSIEEKKDQQGIVNEQYSLEGLWITLYQIEPKQTEPKELTINLFILFEKEFARTLSPIEIEMINIWLDEEKYELELIKAALREAVLMSKLNFKYIDRILSEWKRKGIRSEAQAKKQARTFHQNQSQTSKTAKTDSNLYYNWLDED